MLNHETMDWRCLLLRMCVRFFAILRKEYAEETEQPRCYIIDDTTLEKTGVSIEGISRVFELYYFLQPLDLLHGNLSESLLDFLVGGGIGNEPVDGLVVRLKIDIFFP